MIDDNSIVIYVRSDRQESRIDIEQMPLNWPDALACLQRSGLFSSIKVTKGGNTLYWVEGKQICAWAPAERREG